MIAAWIALGVAALVVAALVVAHGAPAVAAALTAAIVAGLWAYVLWLHRRARKRAYHRHGRADVIHHLRPPRRRRVWAAICRLRTLRLRSPFTIARTS